MTRKEIALILGSIALFFVLNASESAWQDHGPRSWSIRRSSGEKLHLQFEMRRDNGRWSSGFDVPWSAIHGLTPGQLEGASHDVKFQLVRDAGSFECTGTARHGSGSGSFEFRPNAEYTAELRRLGYDSPTEEDLFSMAMMDVSIAFARGVRDGLHANVRELIEMRIHGVDLDLIKTAQAAGYSFAARDFVQMRIHGVKSEFLRDLKAAGYNYPADKIVQLRIHGVTSELMRELKDAGYDLPPDDVVQLNIHGAKPEWIRQLKQYGLQPPARELVEMRIHGVSPEYLAALKDAGYTSLETRDVVQLKIHGVAPEFVRDAKSLGYNFSIKELVELRIHGVDAAYLRKLSESGFKNLNASQIARLRMNGVD